MSDERRERERQAARTTIVGGQPPGNEREVDAGTVPVGIESLLAMAAVDASFAEALYERRDEAIAASGVTLSPAEQQILAAVEQPVLQQMVANVGSAIPEPDRRAFLGRSAAALLAISSGALGVGTGGGCKEPVMVTGVKPDRPPKIAGVRPHTPPPKPPPAASPADSAPPEPDAAPDIAAKKATPPIRRRTRGIRPDRPRSRGKRQERTLGIRPGNDPFDIDKGSR